MPGSLTGRLEFFDWDTLGEWYVYLLLLPLELAEGADPIDARGLARAWDGDTVLFRDRYRQRRPRGGVDIGLGRRGNGGQRSARRCGSCTAPIRRMRASWPQRPMVRRSGSKRADEVLVVVKNVSDMWLPILVEAAFGTESPTARARARPSLPEFLERLRPVRLQHALGRACAQPLIGYLRGACGNSIADRTYFVGEPCQLFVRSTASPFDILDRR